MRIKPRLSPVFFRRGFSSARGKLRNEQMDNVRGYLYVPSTAERLTDNN